jgi:hypothetical protein
LLERLRHAQAEIVPAAAPSQFASWHEGKNLKHALPPDAMLIKTRRIATWWSRNRDDRYDVSALRREQSPTDGVARKLSGVANRVRR